MKRVIFKLLACTMLMTLSLSVLAAKIESIEEAYELPARSVIAMSAGEEGALIFAPCDGCKDLRIKTDALTRFFINGKPVSRSEFRPALRKSSGDVYLFVSTRSGKISRIKLDD